MDSVQIIDKLRETGGNVLQAAAALGLRPQGIYYHVNSNPEVAKALAEIRKSAAPRKSSIAEAIREASVDMDEVALVALGKGVSQRVAAREMLIQKVVELTNRSERDVVGSIRASKRLTQMVERKLPPIDSREEVSHETMSVSLTEAQLRWMRAQPRGTAGRLVEVVQAWPSDGGKGKLRQTTFSLPLAQLQRLRDAANARSVTPQALLRAVIEEARLLSQGRRAAEGDAGAAS